MAFDKQVKSKLLKWEKANPGGRYDEFTETKEFQDLYMNFAKNSDAVYNKYFGDGGTPVEPKSSEQKPSAQPSSSETGGSLRERIDAAKKARGLK
jgi:hypothetical protein